MKASDSLKLVAGVRDLQIIDCEECNCGIVDDIELAGKPGAPLEVAALVVGPGGYSARLPGWAMRLVGWVAGRSAVKVQWDKVDTIDSVVRLKVTAREAGLAKAEARARRLLPGGR